MGNGEDETPASTSAAASDSSRQCSEPPEGRASSAAPAANGQQPQSPGDGDVAPSIVVAYSDLDSAGAQHHSLCRNELLAVTKQEKNGWLLGFKVSDPDHNEVR